MKKEREKKSERIEAGKLKDREILTVAGEQGESFRIERDDFRRIQVFLATISRNVNMRFVSRRRSTIDSQTRLRFESEGGERARRAA